MKTIRKPMFLASVLATLACSPMWSFGQNTMPSQPMSDADKAAIAANKATYGQALIPDLVADPSMIEFDGTFYCYATTDGEGKHLSTSGMPVVWKSKDFLNWSFQGPLLPKFDGKYWAPSSPVRRDGVYYLYPTINEKLTVVTAKFPEGPFLHPETHLPGWKVIKPKVGGSIDAQVLLDDDGQAYMVWQHRGLGKMRPDLLDLEPEGQSIFPAKRNAYAEGQYIFKRNGLYYLLYTQGGDEVYSYAYMYSRTGINGPWIAPDKDLIADSDRSKQILGPGHGSFFKPDDSDQWYFVYLEYGRGSTNRQVYADKMNFNPDGTIVPITVTKEGVGAIRPNAETKRQNIALNVNATASSVRPLLNVERRQGPDHGRTEIFLPGCAVDGSNGTRWMAKPDDKTPWFQIDLGEARDITGTEAYFVQPTHGHAYTIEHSLDATTWQPYGGHDDVQIRSPHRDEKALRTRYLRLTILQGTPGLWEWRVYGTDSSGSH